MTVLSLSYDYTSTFLAVIGPAANKGPYILPTQISAASSWPCYGHCHGPGSLLSVGPGLRPSAARTPPARRWPPPAQRRPLNLNSASDPGLNLNQLELGLTGLNLNQLELGPTGLNLNQLDRASCTVSLTWPANPHLKWVNL